MRRQAYAARQLEVTDSDVLSPHTTGGPEAGIQLVPGWLQEDTEMSKHHLHCLDGDITKYDDELFLSETSTLSPAHIISGRGRTARGPGGSGEDQPRVAGDYREASS